ncbi:MAG: phosphoenolpyruvate carboxylase [Chloroflexota bacterium]
MISTLDESPRQDPSVSGDSLSRLRQDVRILGELVGDVLKEQGGQDLFEAVELVRGRAIALRAAEDGGVDSRGWLRQWMRSQPTPRLMELIRAFSIYFHVINLAEQRHRLRRLRQHERDGEVVPQSIDSLLRILEREGQGSPATKAVRELRIHPVFTAHPSEVRRRTLLRHLERLAELLEDLDDASAPPGARSSTAAALLSRITLIWQTSETRLERPAVIDEVQSAIYFLAGTVYDVSADIVRSLAPALDAAGGRRSTEHPVLEFGSWVGSDQDGNPGVTEATTRAAARLARAAILARYRVDVERLGRELSVSLRVAGASPELLASIDSDREELATPAVARWKDEPYRRKMGLINERLRRVERGEPGGYGSPAAFERDLALVSDSLRRHRAARAAEGPLLDLQRRVSIFGFHLAELEVRQHADKHAAAVAEILALNGTTPDFLQLDETGRRALLARHMVQPTTPVAPEALSLSTRKVLSSLEAMLDLQRENAAACHTYIISMTRQASDVLAVLVLAQQVGLAEAAADRTVRGKVDVVPLFETIDELGRAGSVMQDLFSVPAYREALRSRGNRQQVMVGYSDSNKDGGYLAATWHIYRAQQDMQGTAESAGIELEVFHGRGGAVGRGGGPMSRAILALPPELRRSGLKTTEQGEVIFARYSQRGIARRHFEQVIYATVLSAPRHGGEHVPPAWIASMERMSAVSREVYSRLTGSPAFLDFFRQATPFPELATLNSASRPVSRAGHGAGQSLHWDDLRAIPWVFSWTQSRANLPGWFGLGSALQEEAGCHGVESLRAMHEGWPFFATMLHNAQISLATADMQTASQYATLAEDASPFEVISAEYQRAIDMILLITGEKQVLAVSPVLAQSIKLRNPYVDALHFAQVALIERYRALPAEASAQERQSLLDAIHHSINGIAAGLQTTG